MSFGIPVRNGLGIGLTPSTSISSGVRGTRPAMFLDFLNTTSLSGMVTFTRASTATFTGSDGLIQTAAINAPRFDYDPVTLAPKGLLIEEQRTNLLTGSADFTATYWPVATNAVVTADNTTSPDGTTNADRLADNTTAGVQHRIYRDYTFTATSHTLSVFAKRNDHRWLRLFFFDGTTSFFGNFDLLNGVVGSKQASATTTITAFGNGWYRCTMTATTAAAAGNIQLVMLPADDAAVPVLYTGTGTSLWLFGAQLEAGAFATSYIPTVASQVTRSADQASMTGTNFSSWYNQPQGTFVAIFTPDLGLTSNATRVMSTTSGGVSNRVVDTYVSGTNWVNYNGTTTTIFGAAVATSIPQRIAIAYATANYGYVLNGGSVTVDTTALVNTPTLFNIGNMNTASQLNGHIRQIAYYNTRLPNAQLQTLTEIPGAYSVDYLAVAGGASGGSNDTNMGTGGGGAGGLLSGTSTVVLGTTYTVAVGAGGAVQSSNGNGLSGNNSSALGVTATGGGAGSGVGSGNGVAGGSGGGGSGTFGVGTTSGGAGTSGQGFAGGGGQNDSVDPEAQVGGGGGGSSAVGSAGAGISGGNGGAGTASSITGASVTYAGGGGGGKRLAGTAGTGGAGGGGAGGAAANGTAGTANRGGGGGGAGTGGGGTVRTGGAGGSGVVIISVPTAKYTGTTTGSPTVTTSGANTILTFTSSGSYTA